MEILLRDRPGKLSPISEWPARDYNDLLRVFYRGLYEKFVPISFVTYLPGIYHRAGARVAVDKLGLR